MSDSAAQLLHFFRQHSIWVVAGLIVLYLLVMWIAYSLGGMVGGIWFPVIFCGLVTAGILGLYFIHAPYPLIVLLAMGNYMGSLFAFVEEGLVPFSVFQLLLVLSFVVFLFHRLYTQNFEFRVTGMELEWFLFIALICFSLLYTPNTMDGVIYVLRYIMLFAMMYMILNVIQRSEHITYLVYALIGISVILAIASFYNMIANPDALIEGVVTEGGRLTRDTLTGVDPNRFAALFLLPIALLTSVSLSGWKTRYRITATIMLFIMLLGVLGTYSRSVMVAAAVMMVIIAIMYRQYQLFLWFAVLGVIVILLIPDLRYFATTVLTRAMDIFAGTEDDSSRIRVLLGIAAVYMFFDSYLLGVGFRGFEHYYTNYFSVHESIGVVLPHNVIYKVGAELGLIGLLLFLFILWKIGHTAYSNIYNSTTKLQRANSIALFASFIAMLIFYQFYGGALYDNNLWAIIAFIFAQQWLIANNK